MISRSFITVAFALMAPAMSLLPATATAQTGKPDLARAQQVAQQVCTACHGADGNSPLAANPSLAGQGAEYISRQLTHYKSGVRVNAIMQAMAAPLTQEEIVALGRYYSRQKPRVVGASDLKLAKAGQSLFRGGNSAGVPACAACHAPDGAGIPKNYPRLAGQHADYTYAQLKSFKAGERGADQEGKDVQGRIMADITQKMTEGDMKAAADYAAGLR
ncbi:MAG: c-type cytochrome [Casimicrobiaceae bacterium]